MASFPPASPTVLCIDRTETRRTTLARGSVKCSFQASVFPQYTAKHDKAEMKLTADGRMTTHASFSKSIIAEGTNSSKRSLIHAAADFF